MSSQISATEERGKNVKAQLSGTLLEIKKLTDESPRTEAEPRADMSVVEELLRAEKAHVRCLEPELATEVDKRQYL